MAKCGELRRENKESWQHQASGARLSRRQAAAVMSRQDFPFSTPLSLLLWDPSSDSGMAPELPPVVCLNLHSLHRSYPYSLVLCPRSPGFREVS